MSTVLIVGAGPTGLVLALWLNRLGINVRIIDKTETAGTTSRALAVQARTLELYRQLDLADAVVERGHKVPAVNLWAEDRPKAHLDFQHIGADLTPYSFLQIFPQDEHERLLIERLEAAGVLVERATELVDVKVEETRVIAILRDAAGLEERVEAAYVAGCDGARSTVRQAIGAGFPGGTYGQIFYVADVEASGPAINGELHVDLDQADFLAVFPLAPERRVRLIGTVADDRSRGEPLEFKHVSDRAITNLRITVEQVNWFSTYRVHHRVADRFRKGRAVLLGDAAHIHSPVGGQGMNTGIGDAINLAWKLAAVLSGRAPDGLLDSYEVERMRFARKLVATTDRAFTFVTAEGRLADVLRTRVAPALLSRMVGFEVAREFLFRTISQITLNYRDGPLSKGVAGDVHGGDRLPWARVNNADNFDTLAIDWHAHVYGAASPALTAWCEDRGLALRLFAWHPGYEQAGFARDALYLVRPDCYVALADASAEPAALDRYFAETGIRPAGRRPH